MLGLLSPGASTLVADTDAPSRSTGKAPPSGIQGQDTSKGEHGRERTMVGAVNVASIGSSL